MQNESFRGKFRKFPTRSNPWAFPKCRFHNKSTYVYYSIVKFLLFQIKSSSWKSRNLITIMKRRKMQLHVSNFFGFIFFIFLVSWIQRSSVKYWDFLSKICAFSRITYVALSAYFSIFHILFGFSGNQYDFYMNYWVSTEKGTDFRKITSSSCKDTSPGFRNLRCTKKPCFFLHPYLIFNFSADLNN